MEFKVDDVFEVTGDCDNKGHRYTVVRIDKNSSHPIVGSNNSGYWSLHFIKLIGRKGMKYEVGQKLSNGFYEIEILEVNDGFYHYRQAGKLSSKHTSDEYLAEHDYKLIVKTKLGKAMEMIDCVGKKVYCYPVEAFEFHDTVWIKIRMPGANTDWIIQAFEYMKRFVEKYTNCYPVMNEFNDHHLYIKVGQPGW